MARAFNGSSSRLVGTQGYLNGRGAADFCVSVWVKPANLTQDNRVVVRSGNSANDSAFWMIWCSILGGTLYAGFATYTFSYSPQTPLTQDHVHDGVFLAWRRNAAGWSRWANGVSAVLDPTPAWSMEAFAASVSTTIGADRSGVNILHGAFQGDIAEVAIWNCAPTDVEMAALGKGLPADQVAAPSLLAYWPLRGHTSPEPEYAAFATPARRMTVVSATTARHPPMRGLQTMPSYFSA